MERSDASTNRHISPASPRSEGNLQPPASAEDKHINAEVQPMKTESTEEPVVETQPPTVAEIKPSVPNFQPTSQNQSSQDANAVAQLAPATDVQSQQQISEGNEQEKFAKQKHAMDFLYKVRVQYQKSPGVYNQFLEIMKDFKSGAIDTPEVISRVKTLFKGNNFLIQEFNGFLPPGYKIEDDEPAPEPAEPQPQTDLEHARNYVRKIKNRFALQPHIYKTFLEILHSYYQQQHSINDVLEEVAELFQNHNDLLDEFKHFLPKTVGESPLSLVAPPPKKPKKKIPERPHKREREKDRDKRDYVDEAPAPRKPERRYIEEYEPPRTREKRKPEKYAPIEPRIERPPKKVKPKPETEFISEVKQRIGSKALYLEFLSAVNLFNQDVITKVDVLYLVRGILGRHKDLYERFKKFIAFEDVDPFESQPIIGESQGSATTEPAPIIPANSDDEEDDAELQVLMEMNQSTIRIFEAALDELENDSTRTPKQIMADIDSVHLKTVERLYGETGDNVIEALQTNPVGVIPVVLKRLKMRNQEWSKAKQAAANALKQQQQNGDTTKDAMNVSAE